MVAFRALQALPIGTRTPGNYSRQHGLPLLVQRIGTYYEHRRGSFRALIAQEKSEELALIRHRLIDNRFHSIHSTLDLTHVKTAADLGG